MLNVNDPTSVATLVHYIKTALGVKGRTISFPYRPVLWMSYVLHFLYPRASLTPGRVRALCSPYGYSSGKIKCKAGFELSYGVRRGIERTVSWLEEKGWL